MKRPWVLICPLDWGLGHATRCVPIIEVIIQMGCHVSIAGSGAGYKYLINKFDHLDHFLLPSSGIRFGKHPLFQNRSLIIAFKVFLQKVRDHRHLKKMTNHYDIIISDNRYGCYLKSSVNILITHQPNPILPRFWSFLNRSFIQIMKKWATPFDEIWIPDISTEPGFAGKLSHPAPDSIRCHYIGLLSRIEALPVNKDRIRWETAALVSGPEPGRSRFIQELIQWLSKQKGEHIIVCGGEIKNLPSNLMGISFIDLANEDQIAEILQFARNIIARSGYSTIMDLLKNKRSALLIPSPGQTEQEYLAAHLAKQGLFCFCKEKYLKELEKFPKINNFDNQLIISGDKAISEHVLRIIDLLNKKK